MDLTKCFDEIRFSIPDHVRIVAVSKTKPVSMIQELHHTRNQYSFGENKVQELISKHELLPDEIDWHFIGHLQTNKVKYITPFIGLVQSVDSFRLINEINKEGVKCNRIIPCLLQIHIATEEAKFGFSIKELREMLDNKIMEDLSHVSIRGVMGMATFTYDEKQIRTEFKTLYKYFNNLRSEYFSTNNEFCEISMGMTDDYKIAIDEGSTLIRIGSGIFGGR